MTLTQKVGLRTGDWAREEWNLGVVRQSVSDIVARGIVEPVHWVEPDPWRILADPYCYRQRDGRILVLAELLNHWEGRGSICSAVLPADGRLRTADFKPFAAGALHLSYPSLMEEDGTAHFTAECFESGRLHLWRADGGRYSYAKTLLDRPAVDPTLYFHDGLWWLFCTFFDCGPNERLHLFYSEHLLGEWQAHPLNPVRTELAAARPAGGLFRTADGRLIRPAQDCSHTYGGSLVLNEIDELSPRHYREHTIRRLGPVEPYQDGIHTLAAAGEFSVIDGKRWHCGPADVARRFIAKGFKTVRQSKAARPIRLTFFDDAVPQREPMFGHNTMGSV